MQLTKSLLVVKAILIKTVVSNLHTTCYNYFLEKDGCVFSAADAQSQCPADPKQCLNGVPKFKMQTGSKHWKRDHHTLARRYDTTKQVFPVLGGGGICGFYDTNNEHGACLWSGTSDSGTDPSTAGWLNGAQTANCGKRLYVQRTGQPDSVVFVPVIDGCGFNTFDPADGCFQIALTNKTFYALNPTPNEIACQVIHGLTWDYDNLKGCDPHQAPV